MDTAVDVAHAILEGFDEHYRRFREISASAKGRFERAAWGEGREANRRRIDLYDDQVRKTVVRVRERFPRSQSEEALWPQIKHAYIPMIYDHRRPECAETFFNSVACRVLARSYYRNDYIFWRPAVATEFIEGDQPTYHCFYPATRGLRQTMKEILASFHLALPFEDLARDLRNVVRALREHFAGPQERFPNFQVQVLSSLFFRNKGAYIIGRIINGDQAQPFAVPIRHAEKGGALRLDALLLQNEHIGALLSLARAYFMADMDVPSVYVTFLRELLPSKSRAELYTALGLQKQGKTLFYRDLLDHLNHSSDRFVVAPGARGMVMMVFTLPSFPYVFKIIRDEFKPPKDTTRKEVMGKYLLVKYHDRVGRQADTLEYSEVAFPRERFDPSLLAELLATCGSVLQQEGQRLIIKHLYIERRMTPLDVWLRGADEARQRQGVREFGRAIRELAEANIFPGDLLPKNFGVTRWGRVVFYDYDEICPLLDVHFRRIPPPRDYEDEMSAEPWFGVGPHDVFPEEFPTFLFPTERLDALFLELHRDLIDPNWWTARQDEIRRGDQPDLFPYPEFCRFVVRYPDPR